MIKENAGINAKIIRWMENAVSLDGCEYINYGDPLLYATTVGFVRIPQVWCSENGEITAVYVEMTDGDYEEWGLNPYEHDFGVKKCRLIETTAKEIAEWLGWRYYTLTETDYGMLLERR